MRPVAPVAAATDRGYPVGMYAVILAGGSGTRQAPLHAIDDPAPFRRAADGRTLLQRAAARLQPLVDPMDMIVVTDRRFGQHVRDELPEARILVEPMNRNTAASVALATVQVERPADEPMVVICADHDLDRDDVLRDALATAERDVLGAGTGEPGPLVAFAVRPVGPDPAFAWIRPRYDDGARIGGLRVYPAASIETSPDETRTRELWESGSAYWAAGIWLWRRAAIREAIERYTPLLTMLEPARGSELALRSAYDRLQPVSLDETVLAGAARDGAVVTVPLEVGWRDMSLSGVGAEGAPIRH